jgi:hypothetical protein
MIISSFDDISGPFLAIEKEMIIWRKHEYWNVVV